MSGRRGRIRGQGNAAAPNQIPAAAEAVIEIQQQPDLAELYKKFEKLGGKPFIGKESIIDAQAWVRSCEKIFKGLKLQDEQKRLIASWQLQGEASAWWETIIIDEPEEEFTWDRFKEVFEKRYMPSAGVSKCIRNFWI